MERSWRARQVQKLDRTETIADGIAVRSPYPEALSNIVGIADDVVLVEDDMLKEAMRIAHRELGVVPEPAGAAGLADPPRSVQGTDGWHDSDRREYHGRANVSVAMKKSKDRRPGRRAS
jgi:hypothetical protein